MLKIKRIFSAFVGMAMAANALITMPFSAFADEETSRTYTYDGYDVSYDVTNSWGNTEIVSVTLSNTGDSAIENWMLYFNPNGKVDSVWDAQQSSISNGISYFRNNGYNDNVAPDTSISFSYAVEDCEEIPDDFTLCQTRATKESGYDVSLNVNQTWGDSFNGDIIIQNNTSEPIESWELTVDTNFTITEITNSWAADVTECDSYKYLLKGTYTRTIPANSSVSLGFNGVKSGNPIVTDYSLTEVVVDEEIVYNASLVKDYTIPELEEMNKDNLYPIDVKKNETGNVTSIDGKFSHILVTDEKSALKALCSVKTLLGMTDPKSELVLDYIYESTISDYKSYFFNQVYKNVPVYGRNVTVVARDYGETMSLDSNYFKISNFDINPVWSSTDIESKYNCENAELVIYTYDKYESNPVLAYIYDIGTESFLASATTGENILNWSNVIEEESLESNESAVFYDENGNIFHTRQSFYNGTVSNEYEAKESLENVNLAVDFNDVDSKNELIFSQLQTAQDKKVYHFDQFYDGLRVFGRVVSLTVNNSDNKVISLDSNVVDIPDSFNTIPNFDKPNESAELVIYTWDGNENDMSPELAYIYDDAENTRTVIAFEGKTLYKPLGKGLDEGRYENTASSNQEANYKPRPRKLQYFPVTYENNAYKLSTKKLSFDIDAPDEYPGKIEARKCQNKTPESYPIECSNSYFYEPEAVSAYVNAIKVCSWYSKTSGLEHYTYASSDYLTKNITKDDFIVGVNSSGYDNAYSNGLYIRVTKNVSNPYTYAICPDVIAHEFTHGVFKQFAIKYQDYTSNHMVAGINEGYADLFAHFADDNWIMFEYMTGNNAKSGERNAANEIKKEIDFSSISAGEAHSYIPFVVRPAYLMAEKYDMEMSDLYKLYYASMSQGRYSDTSTMNSVRINVIKAAKALNFTDEQMQKITAAFDEIWPNDSTKYNLTINAMDYDSPEKIENATITIKKVSGDEPEIKLSNGIAKVVEPDWYILTIKADGYVTYRYNMYMNYKDTSSTISLVKDGVVNGSIVVSVHDYVNRLPIDSVVKLFRIEESRDVLIGEYQTGEAVGENLGTTKPISVKPGYYTVSVEGGRNYFLKSVIVAPGENKTVDTSYYDIDVNKNEITDIFSFNTVEYKEDSIANEMSIGLAEIDHYHDKNGNKIAYAGYWDTQFGNTLNVYCYEREGQIFSVRYSITQSQYETLNRIVELEKNKGEEYAGKFYNLEINCESGQDQDYKYTIAVTASDILSNCTENDNGYYFEFARIIYDNELKTYKVEPNF